MGKLGTIEILLIALAIVALASILLGYKPVSKRTERPVPIAMWVLGVMLFLTCFQPWIKLHGSSVLGFQDATHFWQGQLAMGLIAASLLTKQFRKHGLSGILALIIPALAVHLWMTTSNAILRIEPHAGGIALVFLSIPYTVLAFRTTRSELGAFPSVPVAFTEPQRPVVSADPIPPPAHKEQTVSPPEGQRSTKRDTKTFLIAGASIVLLGIAAWWLLDLRHRHTLTPAERAQAEGWFSTLQGKSWVLLTDANAEIPEQGLDIVKPSVHADKYGKVSIGIALDLSAYSSDFGLGRFTATVERNHDDLAEPKELELTGPGPDGQKLTWRIISPDSMVLSIRNADAGAWGEYIAMPLDRFTALVRSRQKTEQQMLLAEVDKLLTGGGLLRRGIFQSYACGDECVASFLIPTNGQPVPASYVCNNNRFGDIQLSQGNMIGEGDFTNQALVGRSFLFVTQRSLVATEAGDKAALEVVTGMLPMPDEITPELQQRLAVASNVDMLTSAQGNAAAPIVPASQFLSDGEVYDLSAVQEQPAFPGGMQKMYEYLSRTQQYPASEQDAGIQGKVTVQFTVDKDGSIQDVKLLRGVSEGLDREALRIVRSMPKWIPGKLDGRPVKCRFNLPIMFRLK